MGDPYVDPRTGVLRNRLGITDTDELRMAETDISTAALFALETSPYLGEGHFDFGHLRALHVQIFGEVYAWAGKPRSVEIGRGQWFCRVRQIPEFAASIFRDLAAQNYLVGLDRHDLVRRLAATYGQLNALHPFREGNGRTQRAFLTQLGRLGGWRLRWADLDGATNDEASRRSLEAGDDSALIAMFDGLVDEVTKPRELARTRRRVVLTIPAVAEELGGALEQFRAGPYPAEATCLTCQGRYAPADEASVVLLRPLPAPDAGIIAYAHAHCDRSRVLRSLTAREAKAWHEARAREGVDAAGRAVLLGSSLPRAGFAWRSKQPMFSRAGDDVLDLHLADATRRGLSPSAIVEPPDERTPGWSLAVDVATATITLTDPDGEIAFVGDDMDLPAEWSDAIKATGECVLYFVSRGATDAEGLQVAARQGRLVVGLCAATVT